MLAAWSVPSIDLHAQCKVQLCIIQLLALMIAEAASIYRLNLTPTAWLNGSGHVRAHLQRTSHAH